MASSIVRKYGLVKGFHGLGDVAYDAVLFVKRDKEVVMWNGVKLKIWVVFHTKKMENLSTFQAGVVSLEVEMSLQLLSNPFISVISSPI